MSLKPFAAFFICFSAAGSVRAEAALADLIFLLPQALAVGLYWELARPWVLPVLWGIAAFCWLVYFVTGRDAVGDVMDSLQSRRSPWITFSSQGAFTFWAAACSLYVLMGWVLTGPPQDSSSPKRGPAAQPAVPVAKTLPYPFAPSEANPKAQWPSASGMLPGASVQAYYGRAYVMLRNPGDQALWVRLCRAHDEPCLPLRHMYIAAGHHYLMERVKEGRYRLEYTQISGAMQQGMTAVLRVETDPADMYTVELASFTPPAQPQR